MAKGGEGFLRVFLLWTWILAGNTMTDPGDIELDFSVMDFIWFDFGSDGPYLVLALL
jgi:hypothetical protein